MQLIRVTGKLQKEIGLRKSDLIESSPKFNYIGPWHANLIHISAKKCILFVNDKTLFNFIVPNVSRTQIRKLKDLFVEYLMCVLAEEELRREAIDRVISEYSDMEYAKTNSKSVLGSMNELAWHYKYRILESGGIHSPAVPSIIKKLNRMPMSAIEEAFPIEALLSRVNTT
jgi:hypothetical protein